jgi:hypothetical protein
MKRATSSVAHLDVDRIDVGEALEQHRLALHHGLGGERPDGAEAEHRGAVRDHADRGSAGPCRGRRWTGLAAIARHGAATPGE